MGSRSPAGYPAWMVLQAFYLFFSYLVGAIPTGLVATTLAGREDPRGLGSGNIGATNVARVAGPRLGLVTLAGDMGKGLFPTLGALCLYGHDMATGVAVLVVLGHCWPVTLEFRGGKGVATAAGALAALAPYATLAAVLVWGAVTALTRRSSLGGLAAAFSIAPLTVFLADDLTWVAVVVGAIVLVRHKANIERLLKGTERPMHFVAHDDAGSGSAEPST